MRILLQFPEGLKQEALKIAKKYEDEGHEVFISASPCYGACDLALDEARWIKADKLVHFGHNKFVKHDLEIPVEYIPWRKEFDLSKLELILPYLKDVKSLTLTTTVQFSHLIPKIAEFFENKGYEVFLGSGYWATEKGQILGCDGSAAVKDADVVIYIGEGLFHPSATSGKVLGFNPNSYEVRDISADIERIKKRRKAALAKAYSSSVFGIMLSTKVGQFNLTQALWAKKELNKRGKTAEIIVANELYDESIKNFLHFECLINTACPRIEDDWERYGLPVINISTLKQILEWWDSN